jgi:hypothetical protein
MFPGGTRPLWIFPAPASLFTRWGDDVFKKFLETGLNPRGHAADPPMPQYRFSPQDAAAILQYLKSVK